MKGRKSGILAHITSLPSPYGIGDLGPGAYAFVDFLHESKQRLWQILPMTPTNPVMGNSPYSSPSAFAGNSLLISPEFLVEEGYLQAEDLQGAPAFDETRADYKGAGLYKEKILSKLVDQFNTSDLGYQSFISENKYWLDDYAEFMLLKKLFGKKSWVKWPPEFQMRDSFTLSRLRDERREELNEFKIVQYVFYKQWARLKNYCFSKQVEVVGDIPIYVDLDSVDVWRYPKNYKLDADNMPLFVAGAPPDAFSADGQRWGNPVYDWETMRSKNFDWWLKRIHFNHQIYDWVRIDHFRGLIDYWEIPSEEATARVGRWVDVPTDEFFQAMRNSEGEFSIIAEDLGDISDKVRSKINALGFPGMKILQFAFDSDMYSNPYLLHNYQENCVVYTGTHDNNTTLGWFLRLNEEQRSKVLGYLSQQLGSGRQILHSSIHWHLIELAMISKANWAIIPLQDVLGLDESARMNVPGTNKDNWAWRFRSQDLNGAYQEKLLKLTQATGRQ